MIIFSLESLEDESHRRHFIDPDLAKINYRSLSLSTGKEIKGYLADNGIMTEWQPDYSAYYDACDMDEPIQAVISIYNRIARDNDFYAPIQIWSGQCESSRKKVEKWLAIWLTHFSGSDVKMRPIGNTEPAHVLKERWLDEFCNSNEWTKQVFERRGKCPIDFVFDSDEQSIAMWRRRNIFCFDCRQS